MWGDIPFLGEGLETTELLDRVTHAGGVAVLAHPGRANVIRRIEQKWLHQLAGIEVWNRRYDGFAPNRDVADLLRQHPQLLAFSSLDFHTARHFHPLAMVFALDDGISEQTLVSAMRARRTRPTAFRLSALHFTREPAWSAIRGVERGRRATLARARRVKAATRALQAR